MSIRKVKDYFKQFGKENDVLEFDASSSTVKLAASVLGCSEGMIAKSLSFLCGEKAIIILVAGDYKIDNPKYKAEFGTKAQMICYDDVEKYIGHLPGGVCPFAVNDGVEIYLDESLKTHEFVYPACGSSNSAIKLSISELEKYSNYLKWVDVSKPMQ